MKQNWKSTSGAARQVNTLFEGAWGGGEGVGVGRTAKKLGGSVPPTSQNPYPIY